MRLTLSLMVALLAAGVLAGVSSAGEITDTIKRESSVIKCTVTEETYERVAYRSVGVTGEVKQCEVIGIEWGDRSSDFIAAETSRLRGTWDDALAKYERALKNPLGRRFYVEPYCLYYIGICNQRLGDLSEAEQSLLKVVNGHKKAKFFPHANIALGEICLVRGQFTKAAEYFTVVANSVDPDTGRPIFCTDLTYRAKVGNAAALIGTKSYGKALSDLGTLIAELDAIDPGMAADARLLKAEALVKDRKVEEGTKAYAELIDKSIKAMNGGDEEARLNMLIARCYNGLGDAHLLGNGEERQSEALMEYLRVVAVFGPNVEFEYARALAGAAMCFDAIGQKDRAKELVGELKSSYPKYPGLEQLNIK